VKKLLLGLVAAAGLALGFTPQQASAAWVTRTTYRWDPHCCRYVAYEERVWVPDCCEPSCYREPVYYRGYERSYYHDHHRPFEFDLHFGQDRFLYRR
jgi:hypothetical protein